MRVRIAFSRSLRNTSQHLLSLMRANRCFFMAFIPQKRGFRSSNVLILKRSIESGTIKRVKQPLTKRDRSYFWANEQRE